MRMRRHATADVRRLLLCSGKVYVDLVSSELRAAHPEVAICRVEQLYPFPWSDLKPVIESFPKLEELVWVQEEPENMGAWGFVRPLIEELAEGRWPLRYVGPRAQRQPVGRHLVVARGEPEDPGGRGVPDGAEPAAEAHGALEGDLKSE